MYNSYARMYANAMLGGFYDQEDDSDSEEWLECQEYSMEYHMEQNEPSEIDPREEQMGNIVSREEKLYIVLNQLLSNTNLIYNNQVIEATGGSGQGTTNSPMLYDFVEEFAVIEACKKANVPRDYVNQYVDDIVPIAPSYGELETLIHSLDESFTNINFSFNHEKLEKPEEVDQQFTRLNQVKTSQNGAVDYLGIKLTLDTNLTANLTVNLIKEKVQELKKKRYGYVPYSMRHLLYKQYAQGTILSRALPVILLLDIRTPEGLNTAREIDKISQAIYIKMYKMPWYFHFMDPSISNIDYDLEQITVQMIRKFYSLWELAIPDIEKLKERWKSRFRKQQWWQTIIHKLDEIKPGIKQQRWVKKRLVADIRSKIGIYTFTMAITPVIYFKNKQNQYDILKCPQCNAPKAFNLYHYFIHNGIDKQLYPIPTPKEILTQNFNKYTTASFRQLIKTFREQVKTLIKQQTQLPQQLAVDTQDYHYDTFKDQGYNPLPKHMWEEVKYSYYRVEELTQPQRQ